MKPLTHAYNYKMGRYGGFWQCIPCGLTITDEDCPVNDRAVRRDQLQPLVLHLAADAEAMRASAGAA